MMQQGKSPQCKGLLVRGTMSRMQLEKHRLPSTTPFEHNTTLYGVGVTTYELASKRIPTDGIIRLPFIKGVAMMVERDVRVVQENVYDKSVSYQANVEQKGLNAQSDALPPLRPTKTFGTLFYIVFRRILMSFHYIEEFLREGIKTTRDTAEVIVRFWIKSADGFSDRYQDAVVRVVEQIHEQAVMLPRTIVLITKIAKEVQEWYTKKR